MYFLNQSFVSILIATFALVCFTGVTSCNSSKENLSASEKMQKNINIFKQESIPVINSIEKFKSDFGRLPDEKEFTSLLRANEITSPTLGEKVWRYVYFNNDYEIFIPENLESNYPRFQYKSKYLSWSYDG